MDNLPATAPPPASTQTHHLLVILDHLADLYEEPTQAMHGARGAALAIRCGDVAAAHSALSASPSLAINALGLTLERLAHEIAGGPAAAGPPLAVPLLPAVRRGWRPLAATGAP